MDWELKLSFTAETHAVEKRLLKSRYSFCSCKSVEKKKNETRLKESWSLVEIAEKHVDGSLRRKKRRNCYEMKDSEKVNYALIFDNVHLLDVSLGSHSTDLPQWRGDSEVQNFSSCKCRKCGQRKRSTLSPFLVLEAFHHRISLLVRNKWSWT